MSSVEEDHILMSPEQLNIEKAQLTETIGKVLLDSTTHEKVAGVKWYNCFI